MNTKDSTWDPNERFLPLGSNEWTIANQNLVATIFKYCELAKDRNNTATEGAFLCPCSGCQKKIGYYLDKNTGTYKLHEFEGCEHFGFNKPYTADAIGIYLATQGTPFASADDTHLAYYHLFGSSPAIEKYFEAKQQKTDKIKNTISYNLKTIQDKTEWGITPSLIANFLPKGVDLNKINPDILKNVGIAKDIELEKNQKDNNSVKSYYKWNGVVFSSDENNYILKREQDPKYKDRSFTPYYTIGNPVSFNVDYITNSNGSPLFITDNPMEALAILTLINRKSHHFPVNAIYVQSEKAIEPVVKMLKQNKYKGCIYLAFNPNNNNDLYNKLAEGIATTGYPVLPFPSYFNFKTALNLLQQSRKNKMLSNYFPLLEAIGKACYKQLLSKEKAFDCLKSISGANEYISNYNSIYNFIISIYTPENLKNAKDLTSEVPLTETEKAFREKVFTKDQKGVLLPSSSSEFTEQKDLEAKADQLLKLTVIMNQNEKDNLATFQNDVNWGLSTILSNTINIRAIHTNHIHPDVLSQVGVADNIRLKKKNAPLDYPQDKDFYYCSGVVFNLSNKGVQVRTTTRDLKRYVTDKKFRFLGAGISSPFNISYLKNSCGYPLYITEGPFDTLSIMDLLHRKTHPLPQNAISLQGVNNTKIITEQLKENKYKGCIYVAFDSDTAGKNGKDLLEKELSEAGYTVLPFPGYLNHKDANEALQLDEKKSRIQLSITEGIGIGIYKNLIAPESAKNLLSVISGPEGYKNHQKVIDEIWKLTDFNNLIIDENIQQSSNFQKNTTAVINPVKESSTPDKQQPIIEPKTKVGKIPSI